MKNLFCEIEKILYSYFSKGHKDKLILSAKTYTDCLMPSLHFFLTIKIFSRCYAFPFGFFLRRHSVCWVFSFKL